jgi:ribosomal protein S27AE
MFALAIVLRRRRLYRADRIRRRKAIYQTRFELGVDVAIRQGGLAWIGGMPVMRRRIKLLSHGILRCKLNGRMLGKFPEARAGSRPAATKSSSRRRELSPGRRVMPPVEGQVVDPESNDARPHCPKCQMRMITVGTLPAPRRWECLRCGYTAAVATEINSQQPDRPRD